jgi:hypothetical protein
MATKKRKYNTVAEVADAIGLNHHALTLLEFLKEYHPDLALDYDFIMEHADDAARVEADYIREHGTDGWAQSAARSVANEHLIPASLNFSEHEIIMKIVDDYYADKDYEELRAISIEVRPQLKSIFAKYPTDDAEFTASCEYDEMVERLTKKTKKLLEKRDVDALPF